MHPFLLLSLYHSISISACILHSSHPPISHSFLLPSSHCPIPISSACSRQESKESKELKDHSTPDASGTLYAVCSIRIRYTICYKHWAHISLVFHFIILFAFCSIPLLFILVFSFFIKFFIPSYFILVFTSPIWLGFFSIFRTSFFSFYLLIISPVRPFTPLCYCFLFKLYSFFSFIAYSSLLLPSSFYTTKFSFLFIHIVFSPVVILPIIFVNKVLYWMSYHPIYAALYYTVWLSCILFHLILHYHLFSRTISQTCDLLKKNRERQRGQEGDK